MTLKVKFERAVLDIIPGGEVTAQVYFTARDDGAIGKLLDGVSDQVQFAPTFPLTKASLRTNAVDAIKAKYTGAVEE